MENREKYLQEKIQNVQKQQSRNIENSKKKRKGLAAAIIAVVLAGSAALTAVITSFWPKKQDTAQNNKPTQSTVDPTTTIDPEDQISLNELGLTYENPTIDTETPQYGNVTGDINKGDLTEKNNTTWKDQEAANNSSNVGKTEIDDKNGTLEVKPNGDVFVKDEGYEIEKEDGTTTEGTITEEDKQNGDTLPPGYVHDENLNKDVVEEDNDKFVYCDANYYDSTGALVYEKGELISKEDLELAKKLLLTTKPVIKTQPTEPETTVPETTVPEETFVPTQGVVNADGTYTIDGITFETKADYEQWVIQGFEGYAMDLDGIMKPEEEIKANYNPKTK